MAKIYRVELEDGAGPYNHRKRDNWYCHVRGTYDPERNPGPWADGIAATSSYSYGFASERQFRTWFLSRDRKNLARRGFKLSVYAAEKRDVVRGCKQVAFLKAKAKLLERREIK